MPYIKRFNKDNGYDIRKGLQKGERALNAGELNYQIFYFIKHFDNGEPLFFNDENNIDIIKDRVKIFVVQFLGDKPNYQRYNDMTGALLRCFKEINRRLRINVIAITEVMHSFDKEIADYEDLKCFENGDVQ